jgi:hypothetical protein
VPRDDDRGEVDGNFGYLQGIVRVMELRTLATRVSLAAGLAAVVFAAAISTSVAMAGQRGQVDGPPLVPPGFRLHASNGYMLSVLSLENPRGGRDWVYLTMRSRHAAVLYLAPAVVGSTSIEADLGAIGRIDVNFVSSGESQEEHSDCGGKPVPVDTGHYEGIVDFVGEEGYSEVHASSARGEIKEALNLVCPGGPESEGFGGHSPGARLTVAHSHGRRFEFSAMKNSPTRPARFNASISERQGRLFIIRGVETTGAAGSFDFDVPSGTADVTPPKPFAGEASYLRPPGKKARWQGDLSVDLPGRADVRLTGAGTRASLVRAVLNPSHPFRVR